MLSGTLMHVQAPSRAHPHPAARGPSSGHRSLPLKANESPPPSTRWTLFPEKCNLGFAVNPGQGGSSRWAMFKLQT